VGERDGGINFGALLVISSVIGFAGSLICCDVQVVGQAYVGAQVIENPIDPTERWLVDTVRKQAQARVSHAGSGDLRRARRECICHRMEPQRCAGGSEHWLAAQHERDEAEAVLAHEVSHVANGDMVRWP